MDDGTGIPEQRQEPSAMRQAGQSQSPVLRWLLESLTTTRHGWVLPRHLPPQSKTTT
jgi:hypothetical protein